MEEEEEEEEEEEDVQAAEENTAEVVHEEGVLRLRRGPTTCGLFVPDHHYHYCLKLCLGSPLSFFFETVFGFYNEASPSCITNTADTTTHFTTKQYSKLNCNNI